MPTLLNDGDRERLLARVRALKPDAPARWGRMNAPRMVVHLGDQMRHALGDAPTAAQRGPLRLPLIKHVVMYWLPWPKGRIKGPPEAFLTQPTTWDADVATLIGLVDRLVADRGRETWPDHAIFGAMSRQSWGRFSHRHFDHHLRQFGV